MIHPISPYMVSPTLSQTEFAKKKPMGWGPWLKNAMYNGICNNWKGTVLMVLSIANFAASFFAFISGQWGFCIFFLVTAAFDAIMYREIKDFTNLNKRTIEIKKENNTYKIANHNHRQLITTLGTQVVQHKKQITQLGKENDKFHQTNAEFSAGVEVFDSQITQMYELMMKAQASGEKITSSQTKKFKKAAKDFAAKKKALEELRGELQTQQTEAMQTFVKAAEQVKNASRLDLKIITKARTELTRLQTQIEASKEQLVQVTQDLTQERQKLAETNEINRQTARHANEAAHRVTEASKLLSPTDGFPYSVVDMSQVEGLAH